jgi:hypothetical protein
VKTIFALALAIAFAASAFGTGSDELWEVTTQMNMPGLPAGMGAQKQQVCTEKGDPKKAMSTRGNEKCKVTDFKQSGNKVTMTMACPDGTAVMENTYNAAHTEYNGTVKMQSKRGDMTMTMAGRKVGTCDAQAAKSERDAKTAAMVQQGQKNQAQANAMIAKSNDLQIAECQAAVDTMQMQRLGMYARCDQMSGTCQTMLGNEQSKPVATKCMANQAEFCKRYQTMDGFLKANGDEEAAKMCKLSRQQLITGNCPRAAQTEQLAYLGKFCPAEAKPIAKAHCVGRSYTSKGRDKYTDFCNNYLAHNSLDEESQPAATNKVDPKQAVQQGVQQGINKIKGLFGK